MFPLITNNRDSKAFRPKNRAAIKISIDAGQYAQTALDRYAFQVINEKIVTNPNTRLDIAGEISDAIAQNKYITIRPSIKTINEVPL